MSDKSVRNERQLSTDIDQYIEAATRDNTRKTYRSAVEHFEVSWGGRLPTTPEQITRYLATYAPTLSSRTLKTRLAALAQWHQTQGFVNPCAASQVKKVMKGIQAVHNTKPKQAKPLQLLHLRHVIEHLETTITTAQETNNHRFVVRALRNRALISLGFWRGFRSDELTRLRVENIEVSVGMRLRGYLSRNKTDRHYQGTHFEIPALAELCPVKAYADYIDYAGVSDGPVFRKLDRWGKLHEKPLSAGSIPALLRSILTDAKVMNANEFSSHSLRRGFAHWADHQGWSLHDLMRYVGWKDQRSAMGYLANRSSLFANTLPIKP